MSKTATNSTVREDAIEKISSNMYNLERQVLPKTIVKKQPDKGKAYWCAPRKVKGVESAENIDDTSMNAENPKKKRRRKARRVGKNLRRIDILAQPKSMKQLPDQKHYIVKTTEPIQKHKIAKTSSGKGKSISYPRKPLKTNKPKKGNKLSNHFTAKSKLQDSSAIVLPRKVGLRLFSLVSKKLKELANTKNV